MKVTPIRTRAVETHSCKLKELLSESLTNIKPNSVIAITSKVVSLCEENVVPIKNSNKDKIIESEAEYFLPKNGNKYDVYLTIKNNMLVPSSGVDESNTNGYYVMWPKDPQSTANLCWQFIRNEFDITNVGVIITDSTSSPLRWGVTGKCIAYCGGNTRSCLTAVVLISTSSRQLRRRKSRNARSASRLARSGSICEHARNAA